MNRIVAISVALALGLGGCVTQQASPAAMTTTKATSSASEFIPVATSSNMFEIESSRLAMQRSRNPEIKRFAGLMIRDHSKAGRRMMTTVRRAGRPASDAISALHRSMLDTLKSTSSAEFDATYIALQVQAHDEAVALFSSFAKTGDDQALAAFARETLPTLEMHREHIGRMNSQGV